MFKFSESSLKNSILSDKVEKYELKCTVSIFISSFIVSKHGSFVPWACSPYQHNV